MKNEFTLAFNEMLDEKQLPRETVIKALESAMVSAYRKVVIAPSAQHVEARLDADTGVFKIYVEKEVVEDVVEDRTEVLLEAARKVEPEAQIGDMVIVENTPKDFGRVAAQTARQVIQQRLRDAERLDQVEFFEKKVGEIVNGVVQSISSEGYSIGLDRKAEGMLLRKDVIKDERFRLHQHVRALVLEVKDSARAPQIILSRTDRKFLFRLLEIDVPEIFHGIVEVRSIAREPGARAKIAVSATQQGIDPVGACVGMQGKRIQPIVKELHDEKIDVIEWNPDPAVFISKAISPAKVIGVYLGGEKNATVIVPEDQLSLAIGRDGQNARLAAKLTGWRIDIKSVIEAAQEIVGLYESKKDLVEENNDEKVVLLSHKALVKSEKDHIDGIRTSLAKRAEGHPLTQDENDKLNKFVDRVERQIVSLYNDSTVSEIIDQMTSEKIELDDVLKKSIVESGLPKHIVSVLRNAGFKTFGALYDQMKTDPDSIFKLHGIMPKTMSEIASIIKFIGMVEMREDEQSEEPAMEVVETEATDSMSEAASVPADEAFEDFVDLTKIPFEDLQPVKTEEEEDEPEAEEISFDELFKTMRTDIGTLDYNDDDTEFHDDASGKKGKKKKKKKNTEIEYDPDSDSTVVRRKHKRGDDEDWGW